MTVQLTIQNRQAKVDVVPSASSLVIKALKGTSIPHKCWPILTSLQSRHGTVRRRKTSSIPATSLSTKLSTSHGRCGQNLSQRHWPTVARRFWAQHSRSGAPLTASHHMMSSRLSTRARLRFLTSNCMTCSIHIHIACMMHARNPLKLDRHTLSVKICYASAACLSYHES